MSVRAARLTPFRLPLRHPLRTAHGEIRERAGWLLELRDAGGFAGFGEASPLPGFGLEGHEAAGRALAAAARDAVGASADALRRRIGALPPSARGALDSALADLASRQAGVPLAEWLAAEHGLVVREEVPLCALVARSDPGTAAETALRRVAEGYSTLKLKLGADDSAADLARVGAVRRAVGPSVALRLDANGAWKERDAASWLRELEPFGVELVEQPVAPDDVEALGRLARRCAVPIAADEAVRDAASTERLLRAGLRLLVLKPAALGGPTRALHIGAAAATEGAGSVVTSFLDSAVGRTAALHVAAALPGELAAGLATGPLLAADLADAPVPENGALRLPSAPGLGVTPDPQRLRALATAPTREFPV